MQWQKSIIQINSERRSSDDLYGYNIVIIQLFVEVKLYYLLYTYLYTLHVVLVIVFEVFLQISKRTDFFSTNVIENATNHCLRIIHVY